MPNLTVGVPSEIKDNENRVAMQPDGVAELVHAGTRCWSRPVREPDPGSPTRSSRPPERALCRPPMRCSPGPT